MPELRKVTGLRMAFAPCDRTAAGTLSGFLPTTAPRGHGFHQGFLATLLIGSYPGYGDDINALGACVRTEALC